MIIINDIDKRQYLGNTRVHPDMQSTGICNVGLGLGVIIGVWKLNYRKILFLVRFVHKLLRLR